MSRSKEDGKRVGSHRNIQGKEIGSRRGPKGWKQRGGITKHLTHRMEHRTEKQITEPPDK